MSKEIRVGIAEFKARLSHYLRVVRRGEDVMILDRDQPVARLVPIEQAEPLVIRRPAPGTPPLGELEPLPPLNLDVDIQALLDEERADRF